jgi:hypothetical protein
MCFPTDAGNAFVPLRANLDQNPTSQSQASEFQVLSRQISTDRMTTLLKFAGFALLLALLSPTLLHAQSRAELQTMYLNILEKKDLEGWIDSDGDVQFKYEDHTYFLEVDEEDPAFFRLVMANIWSIESEMERIQVVKAIDVANAKVKVAKMFQVRDNVWVSVEGFQREVGDCEAYFERSLSVIDLAINYFSEAMAED